MTETTRGLRSPGVLKLGITLLEAAALAGCGSDLVLPADPVSAVEVRGAGSAGGRVLSQTGLMPAIDCIISAGQAAQAGCRAQYDEPTSVTLTAVPEAGALFGGWGGACSGSANCTISLVDVFADPTSSGDFQVTATFLSAGFPLTVVGTANGSGQVTTAAGLSPRLSCAIAAGATSGSCTATFPVDAVVPLLAVPAPGSVFTGWGGACGGTGECPVSMTEPRLVTAAFAPTGTPVPLLLGFETRREGNPDIYVMQMDGSGQVPLVASAAAESHPAWSPDGSRLAFDRDVGGGNTEIFIANADGTDPVRITTRDGEDSDPFWSPDGAFIAFTRNVGGNREIFIMRADGSEARNVTEDPAEDYNPAWSPTGEAIAFERMIGTERPEVFRIAVAGGAATRLTNSPGADGYATWAPDGARIAFVREVQNNFDIWVMNADGSNPARLTTSSAEDYSPAWSPDGALIAWTSRPRGENYDIWTMNADGSDQRNRSQAPSFENLAAWRP